MYRGYLCLYLFFLIYLFFLFQHECGCAAYSVSASTSDATANIHAIYNPNLNLLMFTGVVALAYEQIQCQAFL